MLTYKGKPIQERTIRSGKLVSESRSISELLRGVEIKENISINEFFNTIIAAAEREIGAKEYGKPGAAKDKSKK